MSKSKMRLPDFLGIGTQKGGTTSLHFLLNEDPRIGLPKCKEVHYFDQEEPGPISSYGEYFEEVKEKEKVGEITPYYMYHPKAPFRIRKLLPEVKLIALLRDPVERAISQYFHATRNGYENLEFTEAINAETKRIASGSKFSHQKHSYVSRSRYSKQLKLYEELFNKQQILILKSEDLFANTKEEWRKIELFLGLNEREKIPTLTRSNKGKGESKEIKENTKNELRDYLADEYRILEKDYGLRW